MDYNDKRPGSFIVVAPLTPPLSPSIIVQKKHTVLYSTTQLKSAQKLAAAALGQLRAIGIRPYHQGAGRIQWKETCRAEAWVNLVVGTLYRKEWWRIDLWRLQLLTFAHF